MKRYAKLYTAVIIGLFLHINNSFTQEEYPEELKAEVLMGDPCIDAEIEECWGEGYASQGYNYGGTSDGVYDNSFIWYASWDNEGLHVAVDVKDDIYDWGEDDLNEVGYGFMGNQWEYDCIEIFINPTGQRNPEDGSYETANASQILFNPLDGTANYNSTGIGYAADCLDELIWVVEEVTGGYVFETLIPWTAILPDPTNLPEKIGFTINVPDSDWAGANTESIALWVGAGEADCQWNNINYFGILELTYRLGCSPCFTDNIESIPNTTQENNIVYNIYPNPAHDYISISSPIADEFNIEIYDMLSRKMLYTSYINNDLIDVSNLKKGTYIIRITASNITKQQIIVIN